MSGGASFFATSNAPLAAGMVTFCIGMVAAFASSEASILAANKLRLQQMAEKGDKRAQAFVELRENEDKMFATILAVENMFIILATSIGVSSAGLILGMGGDTHGEAAAHAAHAAPAAISLGAFTISAALFGALIPFALEFLIVLFGEITPKTYAAKHSTRIALLVSRPLRVIVNLLYPLIKFTFVLPSKGLIKLLEKMFGSKEHGPSITEEELKMMIDRGSQEGILEDDERDLLHNVFVFGDTVAKEVMTVRLDIIGFEVDQTIKEVLPDMLKHNYSQYPVYGDSIDDIRGILYLRDLFYAQSDPEHLSHKLERYMRPTLFVPATKEVSKLLELMQTHKTKAVIVADEYGGTEGMVSINDILGELVNIEDEPQPMERFITQLSPHKYRVQGMTPLYDVNETLNFELPEGDYQTIAGFVLSQLTHIPKPGETFTYENLEFTVVHTMGPRILELHITQTVAT